MRTSTRSAAHSAALIGSPGGGGGDERRRRIRRFLGGVPMHAPVGMALRGAAAAGVLLSADVHLELWQTGFKDIDTIGPLFMLNAIGGFLIGLAVLAWRHWLTLLAAAGFGVATLVAFYISVTVGLFGLQETAGGVQQVTAEVAEYIAIGGAVLAFLAERAAGRSARVPRPR